MTDDVHARLMSEHATYRRRDGSTFVVEYDPAAPCIVCGLPVRAASMGGTAVCPWCDMGTCRYDRAHRVDSEGAKAHYARAHPERSA